MSDNPKLDRIKETLPSLSEDRIEQLDDWLMARAKGLKTRLCFFRKERKRVNLEETEKHLHSLPFDFIKALQNEFVRLESRLEELEGFVEERSDDLEFVYDELRALRKKSEL